MTVVLWPLDKKLFATVNGEEFIFPLFVWGRLWRLFSAFGEDLLTRKQREYGAVPDIVIDENQQVSAQHVQEILRRIDGSIVAGTFEKTPPPRGSMPKAPAGRVRRQRLTGRAFWSSPARWATTGFRFRVESGRAGDGRDSNGSAGGKTST